MLRAVLAIATLMLDLPIAPAANPDDAKLEAFFRKHLDDDAKRHPVEASRLGDYRYADRMNDLSPKARAEDLEVTRKTLARLDEEFKSAKLSPEGRIDFEILRHELGY